MTIKDSLFTSNMAGIYGDAKRAINKAAGNGGAVDLVNVYAVNIKKHYLWR